MVRTSIKRFEKIMCNRLINNLDIMVMKGHAWDLKEISIIGSMGDGMSVKIRENYKEHLKKKSKEV